MKKFILVFLFLACFSSFVYSLDSESWLRIGFEYGNYFDSYIINYEKTESYTGAAGINIGGYRFFNNKNYGLFVHGYFGVPLINSKNNNFKDYDFRFHAGIVFGMGFKYNFTEKLFLNYGIGISYMMGFYDYYDYLPLYGDVFFETKSFDIGIAGDVGLKFDFNKNVFIAFGSIFSFDFLRSQYMKASFEKATAGIVKDFYMYAFKPYLTIGFNIFQKY